MDIRILISFMASVLFLGGYSPAEACKCFQSHPQTVYCNADAVLQMKILKSGTQSSVKGYNTAVDRVLKGSENFKTMSFVSSMAGTDCELTINSEGFKREYIVAVSKSGDGKVSLGLCSFFKLLRTMPPKQIAGMQKAYAKGCGCTIIRCAEPPCPSVRSQCILEGDESGEQAQTMMCVPDAKGICNWKTI